MSEKSVVPDRFPRWVRAVQAWWKGSPPTTITFDPTRPLDSARFQGQPSGSPPPSADFGESKFKGAVVTVSFAASEIAKVLPPGIKLAPRNDPSSEHPVLFLTGKQAELRGVSGGTVKNYDGSYQEAILMVPFTVATSGTGKWHNFVARMYLDDNAPAVIIGDLIYQYSKKAGVFTPNPSGGRIIDDGTDVLLDLKIPGGTSWSSAAASPSPAFADLLAVLRMPILGYSDLAPPPVPSLTCSFFEWDVSAAEWGVAAGTEVEIHRAFRTGMGTWPLGAPLAGIEGGTFHVRKVVWRIALPPTPCAF